MKSDDSLNNNRNLRQAFAEKNKDQALWQLLFEQETRETADQTNKKSVLRV